MAVAAASKLGLTL